MEGTHVVKLLLTAVIMLLLSFGVLAGFGFSFGWPELVGLTVLLAFVASRMLSHGHGKSVKGDPSATPPV